MRSTRPISDARIQKIEKKLTKVVKELEALKREKADLEWQLGRFYQGKLMSAECRVDSPGVMCPTCDCWKKTREMCS